MWVNNKTFHTVGYKYHKQYLQYPATFCNVSKSYDKGNCVARYHFLQCPSAEFTKKYKLMHILPQGINQLYWILLCDGWFIW